MVILKTKFSFIILLEVLILLYVSQIKLETRVQILVLKLTTQDLPDGYSEN